MDKGINSIPLLCSMLLVIFTLGCSPEIGSEEWCTNMKEKPKGDWTTNEAADFTKHCLFKSGE